MATLAHPYVRVYKQKVNEQIELIEHEMMVTRVFKDKSALCEILFET